MSLFKVLLDYLAYLNLVIATSAFALAAGVANVFGIDNYWEYGFFSFFSTFCVYNSQRLFKLNKESKAPRLQWMYDHRKLVIISILISLLLALYYFFRLINGINVGVIALGCAGVLISFFYVVGIGKKSLRDISYVKTHAIALTWTLIILVLPVVNESIYLSELLLYFIPAHYLYFLAIAASFDINDLKVDPAIQRTIPQIVGFRHTKAVAIVLLIISTIGISYCFFDPLIILAILTQVLLIGRVTGKQNDIYFNILIDGAIALLGISYLAI